MELKQVLKVVWRWWWLGAIPVLVVGLYVVASYQAPGPVYQVVMHFATGGEPAPTLSEDYDRYYAWLASEYVANGLADLAVRQAFAADVAARLEAQGISVAPAAIQGAIAADNTQSMAVVYVTWPDPAQIVTVAEAVSAELVEAGPRYYPQMAELGLVARQVDAPQPVPLAPGLRARLMGPALRLGLAAAVGVGLIFLAHYLDPMLRDRQELAALGVPLLARIPRRSRRQLPRRLTPQK